MNGTIRIDGQRLRTILAAKNMTISGLADAMGITRTTIYNIMDGANTTLEMVERIATEVGVNPLDLFRIEGFSSPHMDAPAVMAVDA